MPRVCVVCSHDEREAIDKALLRSTPNRRIPETYGVKEGAVSRHKHNHLLPPLAKARAAQRPTPPGVVAALTDRAPDFL